MRAREVFRFLTSARVTIAVLCLLSVFLLLNVVLPQESVLGREAFAELVGGSAVARFFLVTLGLGHLSTSPLFLGTLALFYLELVLVLVSRLLPTWHRLALKPRSEKGLQAWARLEESLSGRVDPDFFAPGHVVKTLRGFGYQVRRVGDRTFWAVKHRTAPVGFLLFHLSFLLLFAGGVLVFYTRFVGSAVLSEGQEFTGRYTAIQRQSPIGSAPDLRFTVANVDPRVEGDEQAHLSASFRIRQGGSIVQREARVNYPAKWGITSILVNQAGLAPVLWLQDANGFTIDRLVVPVRAQGGAPTDVRVADGRTILFLVPLDETQRFPSREELGSTPMEFRITQDSRVVFDGKLRPGEAATFEGGRLVLEEIRYWVGVSVISERGGGLLITGFVIGIIGLIWRLLWYRRELAVTWDESRFHLVGRCEYFSQRFEEELRAVRSMLERPADAVRNRGKP